MPEDSAEKIPEKTRYFSSVALRNLSSARMLWAGEALGKNREGLDIWRNVSEHCLVQTAACDILAQGLKLPDPSRRNLGLAAMVHDWDKKYESTGLRKINQQIASGEVTEEGGKLKYDFVEESGKQSIKGMEDKGIPEDIIRIASADGHTALTRVMKADCSIEEKVLQYVGSITDESNIVLLDQRVDNLENNERYKMMNEYGRQVEWTGGRTLYEMQRDVGHQIEQELVKKLLEQGSFSEYWKTRLQKSPRDLPVFILERLQAQYS